MTFLDLELDAELRESAFAHLRVVQLRTGGPVRKEDVENFQFRSQRIPLMDPQRGIRKPAILHAALSIRTVHSARPDQAPYADEQGPDGYLRYKWRGTDPNQSENRALRIAYENSLPLIWFQGFAPALYLPVFPVWLVAEEPLQFQFVVALDLDQTFRWPERNNLDAIAERRYAFRISQDRLHQPLFRARVLTAYHERCALCRFRHTELLDAAHIRPDSKGGQPTVVNGIAMCRIHHGAYDANLLGINRQLKIVIRPDLLLERDGPTLRTMQELNGVVIEKPSSRAAWPDLELVSERFEEFQQVC